jgi:peptide deformylase
MILPVTVYGDTLLRKVAQEIDRDFDGLPLLIENMYDTMYNADGVGLAAPQVGLSKRIFIVDGTGLAEEEPGMKDFKKVFINPQIISISGEKWEMEEGCLSLPGIRENVLRQDEVTIKYFDENWNEKTESYKGFAGRVIQHEYDHLEGKLFVDYVSPLRRKLLKGRLAAISKGKTNAHYRIIVPGS